MIQHGAHEKTRVRRDIRNKARQARCDIEKKGWPDRDEMIENVARDVDPSLDTSASGVSRAATESVHSGVSSS